MNLKNHEDRKKGKKFFDSNGYLVIKRVLTNQEIDACNYAIDSHRQQFKLHPGGLADNIDILAGAFGRSELRHMLSWPPPEGDIFRKLLVHPLVVSFLTDLCGRGFRLDAGPAVFESYKGTEGERLHGSNEPFEVATWYENTSSDIYCRSINVAWQLYDIGEGTGGFVIIPGSHKSKWPKPRDVDNIVHRENLVYQPTMDAGDVLLFTGAATHGSYPWKGSRPRRCIIYKYTPRNFSRAVGRCFTPKDRLGERVAILSKEIKVMLQGPGYYGRRTTIPSLSVKENKITCNQTIIRRGGAPMKDEDKYLWDTAGFVIYRKMVVDQELEQVKSACADHAIAESNGCESGDRAHGHWHQAERGSSTYQIFEKVILHRTIIDVLNEVCGPGFRLDRGPLVNSPEFDIANRRDWPTYRCSNGRMYCTSVMVRWNLGHTREFRWIPGSHKATATLGSSLSEEGGLVTEIGVGDVIILMDKSLEYRFSSTDAREQHIDILYAERGTQYFLPNESIVEPKNWWGKEAVQWMTPRQKVVMYGPGDLSAGQVCLDS